MGATKLQGSWTENRTLTIFAWGVLKGYDDVVLGQGPRIGYERVAVPLPNVDGSLQLRLLPSPRFGEMSVPRFIMGNQMFRRRRSNFTSWWCWICWCDLAFVRKLHFRSPELLTGRGQLLYFFWSLHHRRCRAAVEDADGLLELLQHMPKQSWNINAHCTCHCGHDLWVYKVKPSLSSRQEHMFSKLQWTEGAPKVIFLLCRKLGLDAMDFLFCAIHLQQTLRQPFWMVVWQSGAHWAQRRDRCCDIDLSPLSNKLSVVSVEAAVGKHMGGRKMPFGGILIAAHDMKGHPPSYWNSAWNWQTIRQWNWQRFRGHQIEHDRTTSK